ncbi:MAG: heme lyase CcmF/NrfE family subunit [Sedimentisphaerales bacterium]|nr:heme lyase CcmF/NrfE family subunit [Sedimentisphaerales bacterium]
MAELGTFILRLALFISLYAIVIDAIGAARRQKALMHSGRNALWACWLCLSAAMAVLLIALIQNDFSIKYVAGHSSILLPLPYKLSALWAGSSGSLLLWLWMQVGITALVFNRASDDERFAARARMVTNVICGCFLVVLLWDKNFVDNSDNSLFATYLNPPADGNGLNPLLQHPAMVFHPPALFLGYAAYIIPFAWALAALAGTYQHNRPPLFIQARNWMLTAWLFLTIGNILGSWWAYEELGWGGFWAWDPVENSSLMPWLIGTALLHSFKKFRPGSRVARWVFFLCLFCYTLSLFGTFLTRSGVVASVHAFPDPGLSYIFPALIAAIWSVAFILAVRGLLSNTQPPDSREVSGSGIIIWVNWIFIVLFIVIFLGTMFPLLSAGYKQVAPHLPYFRNHVPDSPITLQSAYFTKITAPVGLLMFLLIGLCPLLFRRGFQMHWRLGLAAVTAGIAIGIWFMFRMLSIPCFIISAFVTLNIIIDFIRPPGVSASGSPRPARPLSWYGALMAHTGVVLMFVAIAGAEGFGKTETRAMRTGQTASFFGGQYDILFEQISTSQGPNYSQTATLLTVYKNGKFLTRMEPAIAFYERQRRTSEPHIRRTLTEDLYVTLVAIEDDGRLINIEIRLKPLINWLWLGSIFIIAGALLVLFTWYRNRPKV